MKTTSSQESLLSWVFSLTNSLTCTIKAILNEGDRVVSAYRCSSLFSIYSRLLIAFVFLWPSLFILQNLIHVYMKDIYIYSRLSTFHFSYPLEFFFSQTHALFLKTYCVWACFCDYVCLWVCMCGCDIFYSIRQL